MEAGINEEIFFNDGGDVLVVGYVLRENNECNGDISHRNSRYIRAAELAEGAECLKEGEIGHCKEGLDSHAARNECAEAAEVDNFKSVVVCSYTDNCKDCRNRIAGDDTDDERDKLNHLLAEDGAEHGHKESDKSAGNGDIDACRRLAAHCVGALLQVADSVAGERKSYNCDCGSDNGGRHEPVYPVDAGDFNRYCEDDIDETRKNSAEDQAEIAECDGCCARESGCH